MQLSLPDRTNNTVNSVDTQTEATTCKQIEELQEEVVALDLQSKASLKKAAEEREEFQSRIKELENKLKEKEDDPKLKQQVETLQQQLEQREEDWQAEQENTQRLMEQYRIDLQKSSN